MTIIAIDPRIALAVEQAKTHEHLAAEATTDAERKAHLATMRALDKAAMEMAGGNMPRRVADGIYMVASRTQTNVVYRCDVFAQACTCENRHACWHLAAATVCEECDATAVRAMVSAEEGDGVDDSFTWDDEPQDYRAMDIPILTMPNSTNKLPAIMIVAQVFRDGMRVGVIDGERAERVALASRRDRRRKPSAVSSVHDHTHGIAITLTPEQIEQLLPLFDRVDDFNTALRP